ncbi:hypothetical protein P168DRAFT_282398 [Aspergillus campestris IBT 28561]|uniref:Uncharacterized protein n=1 Tax=Aspergillus campestris (strain IBT 28561) TaxID=1392248 RepID=A0A2I1D1C8_ASPC2|nr:uncharacterized protein P168DRAFT_282398 [Aspergillus campestris IBT 28561]PKY03679.1 hypothetical protein P168DRAFT_282398 [Aspergillus campestris IBT 28561]
MQLFAFATFIFSALAIPLSTRVLPLCSAATPRACACPSGTTFVNSTTWARYPATVKDVTAITGNYFETAWFGSSPIKTAGHPYMVGADRTLMGELPNTAAFPATERLTMYKQLPFRSGFQIKYDMVDTPFHYNQTNGEQGQIAGYWEYMEVRAVGPNRTHWLWNIYSCFSTPSDFEAFHESAMNNVSSILESRGQMHGRLDGPHSY